MSTVKVGIIVNGATGRMGKNQHLMRALVPIIEQGGLDIGSGRRLLPDPILVGRDEAKLKELGERLGIGRRSTNLRAALADPASSIYFDAQITARRYEDVAQAIAAGKHVYCEKPVAANLEQALELCRRADAAGVKHGVVQDKLWLPGLVKLARLRDTGFFGRILSVRGEFGYWVFEGHGVPAQRPSWNYRKQDQGGIITDMLCHWRYMLHNLFAPIRSLSCLGTTHIHERVDESGKPYPATAEDAFYACFQLEGGIVAQINSSWTSRVRRDDLLTLHVDGTHGSAVAGLRHCWTQHYGNTPRPVWNPDAEQPFDFRAGWSPMPDQEPIENAARAQWERFLRHVVTDSPFPFTLHEGAKDVQLGKLGLQSWAERRWLDVPELFSER